MVHSINGRVPLTTVERMTNTIAFVAAEMSSIERAAVTRALYAAMLAAELNIAPSNAADRSRDAAWLDPERGIADRVYMLVENAYRAQSLHEWGCEQTSETSVYYADDHVPANVRDRAANLVATGRKIEAIRYVRDETGCSLSDAKDFVNDLHTNVTAINAANALDNEPPF